MDFFTARDLKLKSGAVWSNLAENGEAVITINGKPSAMLIEIPDGQFDETVRGIRQARAMQAFNYMRGEARKNGYMSEEEIEKEISALRKGD